MKAILWTNYGPPDVLQLQEIENPVPKDHEVRIRVHATSVTAGDCEMRRLNFPLFLAVPMRVYVGIKKPKRITILGQELAGEIESVGKGVTRFRPGDPVFGLTGFRLGAYAEYLCLPAEPAAMDGVLASKPANLTYEQAAGLPLGGIEALHHLRKGKLQPRQKILINGAGGSIGTVAVQLAKHFGAEVTAVDSAGKLDLLRSLGADQEIDYAQENFTLRGETYDVIFDVAGKASFSGCLHSLKPGGRYLLANPRPTQAARGRWISMTRGKQVLSGAASYQVKDLNDLKELVEAGTIRPVIDRTYPLEQIAEAHRYVETGQKKGNVVIRLGPATDR